ncbi:protein transporter sec9 [Malassezia pachydermatis]|uniref:Protein transport protein SEC9 n=1 Tax=Malassezia pachydermatis TaxID=77020 RepID=A0A0M8MTT7_9BASI|nr:protein transporter sec9 [Malassezia pachydermatis]KOS13461.1 protein transporter sec9 [Malassezia pachydermatis]
MLFKSKPKIPPVADPSTSAQTQAPMRSSQLDAYVAARQQAGGARDPYGAPGGGAVRDPYGAPSAGAARDPYGAPSMDNTRASFSSRSSVSRSGAAPGPPPSDADLLAEYGSGSAPPPPQGTYMTPGAPSYRDPYSQDQLDTALDPEEEEIQAIKYQIRNTKQESLSSTRNALRLARETEETATNTMIKLGEQSDSIGDTERSLDIAKAHASRAEDNARTIAQLNQSIFRPKWKRNKQAKRDAEEARAVQRHIDERMERELTRAEMLSSQRRVEETVSNTSMFGKMRQRFNSKDDTIADPSTERERYQFEATQSDDELEDELDSNLDEISALSSRMNLLSRAMGQEVDEQNKRLQRVSDKTTSLDTRIYAGTKRLERLK